MAEYAEIFDFCDVATVSNLREENDDDTPHKSIKFSAVPKVKINKIGSVEKRFNRERKFNAVLQRIKM